MAGQREADVRVLKYCVSFSSWQERSRCENLKCCVSFNSWPGRGRCESVEMLRVFQQLAREKQM